MTRPFSEYRDTPLWMAIAQSIDDLLATGEVHVDTAPQYVIGYLCRELAAKRIVVEGALRRPS